MSVGSIYTASLNTSTYVQLQTYLLGYIHVVTMSLVIHRVKKYNFIKINNITTVGKSEVLLY